MNIDGTQFGMIMIDGETYDHDVLIRVSGKVKKRKKRLSKRLHGTSHFLSLTEAEFIYEKGIDLLIVGTGQNDSLRLSPEAEEFFAWQRCEVVAEPTPRAIVTFNQANGHKVGLFHVTC